MAFIPEENPVQFADLKSVLSQSKAIDPALYQTLQILIERLDQFKTGHDTVVTNINNSVNTIISNPIIPSNIPATYLTVNNETAVLPVSVQLLAGTGITFDDSVLHRRVISSSGGSADLDYLGNYVPGTYNDGDIVIGADGVAYMCTKDGTTTPPEAWPGGSGGIVTPSIHHVTHEPGGNDQIPNVAWTNLFNTFTQNQLISKVNPELQFLHNFDVNKGRIYAAANSLHFSQNLSYDGLDSNLDETIRYGTQLYLSNGQFIFYIARPGANPRPLVNIFGIDGVSGNCFLTGILNVSGGLGSTPLNASNLTSGTVPDVRLSTNVALKNIDNHFVAQTIAVVSIIGPSSQLYLYDTSATTDNKTFNLYNDHTGTLIIQKLNDAATVNQQSWHFRFDGLFYSSGSLYTSGAVYEYGRSYPMGHWINVPFNAANFFGSGGGTWTIGSAAIITNRYTLIGKTMHWEMYISWYSGGNVVGGAPTGLNIQIPGGFTPNANIGQPLGFGVEATLNNQYYTGISGGVLQINKFTGAAFTAGAFGLNAVLTLEIV